MIMITSLQNEKVKYWLKLKQKKFRDSEGVYLVEGSHLVSEALKHHLVREIISLKEEAYPKTYVVTKEILKKLSSQVTPDDIFAVVYKKKEEKLEGPLLLLDGLQDPGNLGTIIRSACAFSFKNICLSLDTVDLYNEKVIRSTEGMHFNCNIVRTDLENLLITLKNEGYHIYTTDVKEGKNLKDISFPYKSAFIIGNEGKGVKESIAFLATDYLHIPMDLACESLNAGVCASIIMYEFRRPTMNSQ